MEDIEYKIYKYELYPIENPDRILVGFLITDLINNKSLNTESTVFLIDTIDKDQEEICQIAYNNSKERIEELKNKLISNRTSVIGKIFLPSN